MMTSEKGSRKDKNQNIQVFVRLRPLNQRERDIKSFGVVEVAHNREVVVKLSQQNSHTKKFTFDRAFGPQIKQVEVYQNVVSPLIEEVLAGYNCTVFAYGQTGTGKTHTMVGDSSPDEQTSWQNDPLAGIIPRALSQLFDELRLSNTEYTVRVSYLELYNEELFDLLSTTEDNSKLRIYEDVTRKGSNIVNGLEEITVSNKNEVYKIMSQGQERKRVASTLMNAQSSRSHTVFTIVVHMRENSAEGEELVKIGKLNLVDLAGSENISKAGSDNPAKKERARECVNINQSLLTLGRVITALVERHPHIPYRESKLTRILQESLGGRTKTSIIATISPGHKDLEETMSTLEYANRAKNIQNKPEINQKMTKKAILKDYVEEIDRLRRDLQASREKNGVYLATDTYAEITIKQEEQRKEIQELLLQKRAVEEQKDKVEALFSDVNQALERRGRELLDTRGKLSSVETELASTADMLRSTVQECEEQKHLVQTVTATEKTLSAQAQDILAAADTATTHVACYQNSLDKRRTVESTNLQVTASYRQQAANHRANIVANTKHFTMTFAEGLTALHSALEDFATNNTVTLQGNKEKLEDILQQIHETMDEIKKVTEESHSELVSAWSGPRARLRASVEGNTSAVQQAAGRLRARATAARGAARGADGPAAVHAFVRQWYSGVSARVSCLCARQRAFVGRLQAQAGARAGARAGAGGALRDWRARDHGLRQALDEKFEKDNTQLKNRLSEQIEEIENERRESENRLQAWAEEERRYLEERIALHVKRETLAIQQRLSKKLEAINSEHVALQERFASYHELQSRLLDSNAQELDAMTEELGKSERAANEAADTVTDYDKEFDEGTSAISSDMEAFCSNVVDVVEHINRRLLDMLELAAQETEKETQSVVSQVQASGTQFVNETNSALDDIVAANKKVADDMLLNIKEKNSACASTLEHVSSCLSTLVSATDELRATHGAAVVGVTSQVALYEDSLADSLASLDQAENKCLGDEYRLYSPTGQTPSRTEYRYPRTLAATSPHDRILARFRAMRNNSSQDDDCTVVESESEPRGSDESMSSMSSDSTSPFVPPSPPPAPRTPRHPRPRAPLHAEGIHKCTSDTDIYTIKKQQDKENVDRSVSYKKPSKLPAPASHKKPFVDRNGIDN